MRKIITGIAFFAVLIWTSAVVLAADFTVSVEKEGYYHLRVRYAAVPDSGDLAREVQINGQADENAAYVVFKRYYIDKDREYKNQIGNQSFPAQIEISRYTEYILSDGTGFSASPLTFWLDSGVNTVTFAGEDGDMDIESVTAVEAAPLITYAQYKQQYAAMAKADVSPIKVQAEDAVYKSSPSLYPVNDRTNPLVEPYDPSYIVLNTIGGWAWRVPGQSITWEVSVPADGLYRLAFKYSQRDKRGAFVSRKLSINGEVPFAEVQALQFEYEAGFAMDYLQDAQTGEEYWFYLQEGVNTITLEAVLGVFAPIVEDAQNALQSLSQIYQDIIMVTSATPDKYRDYQIVTAIPGFRDRLRAQSAALTQLLARLHAVSGSYAETTAIIERLKANIDKIADRPDRIAIYLADFKSSVSALSVFITDAQEQPLLLDYIYVGGAEAPLPRVKAGFFQMLRHNFLAFIGSFTNDYNVSIDKTANSKEIEVWVSTGRDLYGVIGRLINESFVRENPDITINLKLVSADVIFPAAMTGNGPDVVLQTIPSTPVNFGYRGGAVDLTQFSDFDTVAERFVPAAIDTFAFDGAVYALPDQMSFNVLFYRTDVFEKLGLTVPSTMNEFLAIVPVLQKNYMDVYFTTLPQAVLGAGVGASNSGMSVGASTRNLNPVYVSLLYQMGGQLYGGNGAYTEITDRAGVNAFKYWTELYTKHNFIVETDFVTRFRIGEIPVGVYDLWQYNVLNVSAPEIKGNWAIAPIPGIADENGVIRRDNPISVSGNLIVKNIAERRGTVEESWQFLKWFTSDDTQYRLALETEAVWGGNWRYQTANVAAFERLSWDSRAFETLQVSLEDMIAIPQVPGSYITGRSVHNAFLSVVTESENANPTDAIYKARDFINDELTAKRKEFGIDTASR